MSPNRPRAGQLETRSEPIAVDGQKIRGRIPYGTESRDMGGWTEVIEPTALQAANLDDLVATVDHVGVPIGRYPTTLSLEDRSDGLHWAVDPPQSRQDVREAVQRRDLRAGSWRMRVGRDEWRGDVRHIHEISELRDVAVVVDAAYPDAAVELRNHEPAKPEEGIMPEDNTPAVEPDNTTTETTEDRSAASTPPAGSLHVEDRAASTEKPRLGLADEFRAAGFPGEAATIPWETYESRAVTWTPTMDLLNQPERTAGPFPFDQRYAWPALARVAVDSAATSVLVLAQTARSLATAANVVRAVDAVTAKPETGSTINLITVPLKQVATIQSAIPNVVLAQPAINTVIENDLTLAVNEGLDKVFLDTVTASGFQTPGANLILSVRSAMTTLFAAGYNPDTLVLTPADAAALDVLVSGIASGTADFVFSPGQFSPQIWNLNKRVSKTVPASVVLDATAYGKMYMSPVSLARFENASGTTNTGNVRLELNACCGVERQAAAIRIAAS
jgi:phage head maturation protease